MTVCGINENATEPKRDPRPIVLNKVYFYELLDGVGGTFGLNPLLIF